MHLPTSAKHRTLLLTHPTTAYIHRTANKYFLRLEGHMSMTDQVTILIGRNRKLVGHDSTYWHLDIWNKLEPSFLVKKHLAFSTKTLTKMFS